MLPTNNAMTYILRANVTAVAMMAPVAMQLACTHSDSMCTVCRVLQWPGDKLIRESRTPLLAHRTAGACVCKCQTPCPSVGDCNQRSHVIVSQTLHHGLIRQTPASAFAGGCHT